MPILLAVVFGYLSGSVPFGHLLVARRGIDLRRVGSGNVGATNAWRHAGASVGIATLLLDLAKGAVAVLVAERLLAGSAPAVAGVAAVAGHCWPVWLRFRGGKGVATAAGVFVVLAPTMAAAGALVFTIVVAVARLVSLGSLSGAVAALIVALVAPLPAAVKAAAFTVAALIVARHRDNLARLLAGTEPRLGAAR
ncbi:MAG: glycerol-3-phosphate 1-O-acyltransferase PlsY [Acidimicrobiia bacterium]|nr:glycerol-3-phosphate 1-O-acyltransferase PlsY [Acidimicrobiia bacterium]